MKFLARKLCDQAEQLGYVQTGANSRGQLIYTHPSGRTVRIPQSASEHQARSITRELQAATGTAPQKPRRSETSNSRATRRRRAEKRREQDARRQRQAQRDAYTSRVERAPLLGVDREDIGRVAKRLHERDRLAALARETPACGDHQGRRHARHTTGERVNDRASPPDARCGSPRPGRAGATSNSSAAPPPPHQERGRRRHPERYAMTTHPPRRHRPTYLLFLAGAPPIATCDCHYGQHIPLDRPMCRPLLSKPSERAA